MTRTALKAWLAPAIVVVSVAMPLWLHHHGEVGWRELDAALRLQSDQLAQLREENQHWSGLAAAAPGGRLSPEALTELLQLRREIGSLRAGEAAMQRLREENRRLEAQLAAAQHPPASLSAADQEQEMSAETLAALTTICHALPGALQRFAKEHTNRAPESFWQLRNYFPSDSGPYIGLYTFEFVEGARLLEAGPGGLTLFENAAHRLADGTWGRYYAYGDGRIVEVALGPDGGFDAWEKEHGKLSEAAEHGVR